MCERADELLLDLDPGRWTLFLDLPPYAPAVLRNVLVGDDCADLGTVRLTNGSSVRIEVLLPEESLTPRLALSAHSHEAKPAYHRFSRGGRSTVVWLTGLGAGRFRLRGMGLWVDGKPLDELIEVDGLEHIERTIDLR